MNYRRHPLWEACQNFSTRVRLVLPGRIHERWCENAGERIAVLFFQRLHLEHFRFQRTFGSPWLKQRRARRHTGIRFGKECPDEADCNG
jgi:hypothetical protein